MKSLPRIVLASSSIYRKALVARLGLDCTAISPDVDENALQNEAPAATALRLAENKARRIARHEPAALIIGSDQVAVLDDQLIGKPGNHAAATRQLQSMSGKTVVFHTALCLLNSGTHAVQLANVPTTVRFRELNASQIERYLRQDQPYDCAGSAKIEALGIALVEQIESTDPTALIGLPLVALVSMLQKEGVPIP